MNDSPTPFHRGEIEIQDRLGVAERMEAFGRKVIRDHLPQQHRDFYPRLPFLLLGSVDAAGRPWASLLEGHPGFAHSPDPRLLRIDARPGGGDPCGPLETGAPVGLLGIELDSRRRNRLNGQVRASGADGFDVAVEHAFGNCPQYIQLREHHFARDPAQPAPPAVERFSALDAAAHALIRAADTFFVASYADPDDEPARRQVDVSHRGGKRGFVAVEGNCLTIPDFAGNLHFNTLGNLLVNPRAGLLFVDFENGDTLQLSGSTEIEFDGPQVRAFQGAERIWRLRVEQAVLRRGALALRWRFGGFSPNSLLSGSWEDARARREAAALGDAWRPYRVTRLVDESSTIRSIYLEPADAAGTPAFCAGQHLPLRVCPHPGAAPLTRTYSLSCAPGDGFFRISVKRDGAVSEFLHTQLRVGDLLEARAPRGAFMVDAGSRQPLVLLGAGVGVTPLLSMLRHLVYEGQRTRRMRRTFFVQSARTLASRAFDAELAALATQAGSALSVVRVLSDPEGSAREGEDYDLRGRVDSEMLRQILPSGNFEFALCGPGEFTQSLYDGLRALDVADASLRAEQFGPSTLRRSPDAGVAGPAPEPAANGPVPVLFARSGVEARWTPGSGTLLELAEARGLHPEFSCRGGSCGTCSTRILGGELTYATVPPARPAAGEVLICCAVPAAGNNARVELDL